MITKEYLQQELVKRIDGYKRGVETTTDNIITEMKSILVLVNALPYCEKKYNKAIERMRKMLGPWRELAYNGKSFLQDLESIFPELCESEDERIRRTLVEYFGRYNPKDKWDEEFSFKDVLDYLEKQQEQKPIFRVGDTMRTWDEAKRGIKDGLPHIISINSTDYLCNNEAIRISEQGDYEFPPMNRQKPAEWSEEDADILNCCISSIEEAKENRYAYKETDGDTSYDREIDWLKSLRPSWKPSKEQMGALNYAYCELFKREDVGNNILGSLQKLLDDLKKLM